MQEQSGLQQLSNDVAPENGPVKRVVLAGAMERVQNERHQAENIKVRGFWGGPAAEQNVKADAEINKGNQPQSLVHGIVGRDWNHRRDFYIDALAVEQVCGARIDTRALEVNLFFSIALDGRVFWPVV